MAKTNLTELLRGVIIAKVMMYTINISYKKYLYNVIELKFLCSHFKEEIMLEKSLIPKYISVLHTKKNNGKFHKN